MQQRCASGSAGEKGTGDPTELALLELAAACGLDVSRAVREGRRRKLFRFDPGAACASWLSPTGTFRPDRGSLNYVRTPNEGCA